MANIIVGSKFNPFTYQELLAPVLAATQEHKEIEQGLAQLSAEAGVWERLAQDENSQEAYNQYKRYMDDLQTNVNALNQSGLTPGARQNLFKASQRYAKEIIPIQLAEEKRQRDIAAQQELRLKDSSYIFDKNAANLGVDYYLKNDNLNYNALSVNEVYGTVAKDFQEAAKKLMREGKWTTTLGGQYYERKNQEGYTQDEINAVLNGSPDAPKELVDLYNHTLNSYMSRGNWDEQGQQAIRDAINRGAFYGIGSTKSEMQANKAFGMAPSTPTDENDWLNTYAIQHRVDSNNKELQKTIKIIDKYYIKDKNGNYTPNPTYWEKDKQGNYKIKEDYINPVRSVNAYGSLSASNPIYVNIPETLDFSDMGILSKEELRNMTADQVLPLLLENQDKQAIAYAVYDLAGTSGAYKHFQENLAGTAANQELIMGSGKLLSNTRLPGIKDQNGKNVKAETFRKDILEGIGSVYFDSHTRNIIVNTLSGGSYSVRKDMITGLNESLLAYDAMVERSKKNLAYGLASGKITPQKFEEKMNEIETNRIGGEYRIVASNIIRDWNPTIPGTKGN